jgi:hypothetical protein
VERAKGDRKAGRGWKGRAVVGYVLDIGASCRERVHRRLPAADNTRRCAAQARTRPREAMPPHLTRPWKPGSDAESGRAANGRSKHIDDGHGRLEDTSREGGHGRAWRWWLPSRRGGGGGGAGNTKPMLNGAHFPPPPRPPPPAPLLYVGSRVWGIVASSRGVGRVLPDVPPSSPGPPIPPGTRTSGRPRTTAARATAAQLPQPYVSEA